VKRSLIKRGRSGNYGRQLRTVLTCVLGGSFTNHARPESGADSVGVKREKRGRTSQPRWFFKLTSDLAENKPPLGKISEI